VVLNWENAFGRAYQIQVSMDGESWTTVFTEPNGNGGTDDDTFTAAPARYVRIFGTQRGTPWGYSLWELQVFGVTRGAVYTATTVGGPFTVTATTGALNATATVTVVSGGAVNLAQGKSATASSVEAPQFGPALAVDGNTASRWSSAYADPQWLAVDLGAVYT